MAEGLCDGGGTLVVWAELDFSIIIVILHSIGVCHVRGQNVL